VTEPESTTAARLREAAGVVRATAATATKGPWFAEDPNVRWGDEYDHRLVGGGKTLGSLSTEHNGPLNLEWIALMHPGHGALLAAMFDRWARMVEYDATQINRVGGPETLALADAILAAVTR